LVPFLAAGHITPPVACEHNQVDFCEASPLPIKPTTANSRAAPNPDSNSAISAWNSF
jgi:hypothetical protein